MTLASRRWRRGGGEGEGEVREEGVIARMFRKRARIMKQRECSVNIVDDGPIASGRAKSERRCERMVVGSEKERGQRGASVLVEESTRATFEPRQSLQLALVCSTLLHIESSSSSSWSRRGWTTH